MHDAEIQLSPDPTVPTVLHRLLDRGLETAETVTPACNSGSLTKSRGQPLTENGP